MRKVCMAPAMSLTAAILLSNLVFRDAWPHMVTAAHHEEENLFIWTGDQARANADFLAVINFNQHSKHYGEVITTFPLPNPGASGNEPHHVGLSADGNILAAGGLLSVLKGQNEIFFFDVSNPEKPRFLSSANPPLSAITDEFQALPD